MGFLLFINQVWRPIQGGWNVNRQYLQIIGITVKTVKTSKVTVCFADI
jgi:hypothetical protein